VYKEVHEDLFDSFGIILPKVENTTVTLIALQSLPLGVSTPYEAFSEFSKDLKIQRMPCLRGLKRCTLIRYLNLISTIRK
jgi:hypothetical protein